MLADINLPTIITFLVMFASIVGGFVTMRTNIKDLREDIRETKEDIKETNKSIVRVHNRIDKIIDRE